MLYKNIDENAKKILENDKNFLKLKDYYEQNGIGLIVREDMEKHCYKIMLPDTIYYYA